MRKIFIALFLIFFAHCECVSAVNMDGDCGICAQGYFCERKTNECRRIPAGFYKEDDTGRLALCPAGSKCPGWTSKQSYTDKTACETGELSKTGYSSCYKEEEGENGLKLDGIDTAGKNYANKDCPQYQFCTARSGGGKWCLTYECYGDTECYNALYDDGNLDNTNTTYAKYATDVKNACPNGGTACPSNYFCPPGLHFITKCKDGQYCPAGTESPAGYYSAIDPNILYDEYNGNKAAMYASNMFPHPCPPGYYCPRNTRFYAYSEGDKGGLCPAGYYCPVNPANNIGTGVKEICDYGTYSSAGSTSCTKCKAGKYQDEQGKTVCKLCPKGTYSNQDGVRTCTDCGKGKYQPATGQTTCEVCSAGWYSDQDRATECKQCTAGTYSTGGSSECTKCGAGTYSQAGATKCEPCAAGTYQAMTGQMFCANCGAGTYSQAGATKCEPCAAGTFQKYEKKGSCDSCPKGTYSDQAGATGCTGCPTGTTTSGGGAKNIEACNLCKEGYYQNLDGDYRKCEKGYYCPDDDDCGMNICAPGTYQDEEGQGSCKVCPAGTYSDTYASTLCTQCPLETPVSEPGSDDISDCQAITKCSDVALIAGCGGSDDNAARITTCRNLEGCYWNETEKICANCTDGFYCTNCSEKKIKCPDGTTSKEGAKQKSDCYLVDNKLKQNDTEIEIPYKGELYFYTTVLEICDQLSAVCQAPGGTGGTGGTGAGGIVSQK